MKVAHHGSRNSTGERFLELAEPSVGVISCGKNSVYGHPHRELLERLEGAGCAIYRTDLDGAVTVKTDGKKYAVSGYLA